MNRNSESHFANLPDMNIDRSIFDRSSPLLTSFNAGRLIPIYVDEVLPGDTFKMKFGLIGRMTTPVYPVMDNANLDIYFFYVPQRLVWSHSKDFFGENTASKWYSSTEYTIPQLTAPTGGWSKGTIADYMGIPTGVAGLSVNALPVRAYNLIYNEWFRDQNLQDPSFVSYGDSTTAGTNADNAVTAGNGAGMCLPVNKYHDYFTSCLPAAQKGVAVTLPLGTTAPVKGNGKTIGLVDSANNKGGLITATFNNYQGLRASGSDYNTSLGSATNTSPLTTLVRLGLTSEGDKSGMVADLSGATAASINQLREAFQIQKLLELAARGGTRYREIIRANFGVTSPDARQQVPEYLGGKRIPIVTQQVLQTSSTDSTSPQGNTAGFSYVEDADDLFIKSFTEHGYIIGVACLRTVHTYQQGLNKLWNRTRKYHYYWPALAHLGEQAVLEKEIYAQGTSADDGVFGYQEAFAEYRYKPGMVTGAMRSNYATSLDSWHYADHYASAPVLGDTWIRETTANIDRTLSVPSSTEDQFIANFYFSCEATRPMPVYSVPGLIDHF